MTAGAESVLPYRQFLGHRPRSASSGPRPAETADAAGVPGEPAEPGLDGGHSPVADGGRV